VLVFSDIHGNAEAMAALAEFAAGRSESKICLGDVVGYGASPNEAVEWVRRESDLVVRGNHDRACDLDEDLNWFSANAAAAMRWTRTKISPESAEWLRSLRRGPCLWGGQTLAHGSPADEDEYLLDGYAAAEAFTASETVVTWFGHTHRQGGFSLDAGRVQPITVRPEPGAGPGSATLALRPGVRYLLNPGSLGQPRDGDWRAAFARYDEATGEVHFHRLPYDRAGAQAKIRAAGLPESLAERLTRGK